MPFYGESLQMGYVQHIGGAEITNDVMKRAGSATLASGAEWRAWLYPGGETYLSDPGELVTISWVVEVLSGTVTFDASMGIDPAFGSPVAVHATSLGTHTVTGPTGEDPLVLTTTLTAADVLGASDSPMLVLEATSGSAVIQQIKMRVWPPGGAIGWWSEEQPGFATAWQLPSAVDGTISWAGDTGGATYGSVSAAWSAVVADVALTGNSPLSPITVSGSAPVLSGAAQTHKLPHQSLSYFYGGGAVEDIGGGLHTGYATMAAVVAVVTGVDWVGLYSIDSSLTEGVDYIRAPGEVQDDDQYWAQQVGSGATEWSNATATPLLQSADAGNLTITTSATDESPFLTGTTVDLDLITAGSAAAPVMLPTTGRYIILHLSHTMVAGTYNEPPAAGTESPGSASAEVYLGVGDPEAAFLGIRTRAALPPYMYWDPLGVEPEPDPGLIFGSFLIPNPNLDGLGDGVDVNFA